ncbi:MAG: hypothetical protein HQL51_16375 [Magnetococcales bacterium]|nr:hypothetical protein [Magnetococcales bacterium]
MPPPPFSPSPPACAGALSWSASPSAPFSRRRRISFRLAALALCASGVLGPWHEGLAGSAEAKALQGPAFTDPAARVQMAPEWLNQPIEHDAAAKNAALALSLDQQIHPMLEELVARFAKDKGIQIALREGTCGISSGLLLRKRVDMAGFCCPPDVTDRLPGLIYHTLGIVPLHVIVHPDNPIDNLSMDQLRKIFQGEYYRWSELAAGGGKALPPWPIQTVGRLHCKLRPGDWRLILDNSDLFSPRMQEVGAIPDMMYQVMNAPGGIGYETGWHIQRYQEKGLAKAIKINGHDPKNEENLLTLRYPLYRVFSITTWEHDQDARTLSQELLRTIREAVETGVPSHGVIPASKLRAAGWKFQGDELVGEPETSPARPGPPPAASITAPGERSPPPVLATTGTPDGSVRRSGR